MLPTKEARKSSGKVRKIRFTKQKISKCYYLILLKKQWNIPVDNIDYWSLEGEATKRLKMGLNFWNNKWVSNDDYCNKIRSKQGCLLAFEFLEFKFKYIYLPRKLLSVLTGPIQWPPYHILIALFGKVDSDSLFHPNWFSSHPPPPGFFLYI
jgi:hypothetical protein